MSCVPDPQGGALRRGSNCVSAVRRQTRGPPCWVGGVPWGRGGGGCGDTGLRVQEALSGLSVKRKSGCRRSEIQGAFVLGTDMHVCGLAGGDVVT
ncbi:hypothetical protein MJG53_018822 [Ovis ammon polii x Ovis aries]|uniref:Uncharacterized protein n=1 Tax=Ovis ammon polii x Ovis aries TaxID=2918886 RepID=A0ACB9U329_9CETA|nr:hypothetical protein MJG53_018822 [Ovis ammon polii x Ovis aries]